MSVPVGKIELYAREIGHGRAIIVLHGGPDFDQSYLLPEMDRLADSFRLIYYDQRGRGKSAARVRPQDVTLESEMQDLDAVRRHLGLESAALLGHSFGAVLALEYATRHPARVSHLILMNPAPASRSDFLVWREAFRARPELKELRALSSTAPYKEGDPDTVAAYYRIYFKHALKRPDDLEKVIAALRASFTRDGILRVREIAERLAKETLLAEHYDLLPELKRLRVPTLVIYGDHDFIPVGSAASIAGAIPNARLATLKDCGHFAYLECPDAVRAEIRSFVNSGGAWRSPRR